MTKRTIIMVGITVSILGFVLAVASVVIETHIHKTIRDNQTREEDYRDILFRKSMVSSFAEIGIFLGFILMNFAIISHLWKQF